ncbi:hypothetical protein [Streptomyces yaizuensis]|uniref:Uncharacterized protein n=1 Tax=Streptomyces yaizuensis TaxID=2989713 RepID=A0AA86J352_9ACTN|nr:hypothetical protein [Streptomyces sp. YSPA8]BDT39572.1 hypothetical protein SYYSPA8_37270 [Streptomyces sp. YSPA8]
MAPRRHRTQYYWDRGQMNQLLGKDPKQTLWIRLREASGRMLSPDVIVGDEDTAGKISLGWDPDRVTGFFTARGLLTESGTPVPSELGRPRNEDRLTEAQEAAFMARWTSVPKRYLGTRQVMDLFGMTDTALRDRRRRGTFLPPDVVIGSAPTELVDGVEVPTYQLAYGVVHGWDRHRLEAFGRQEGLID